jgi:hypothetical protein
MIVSAYVGKFYKKKNEECYHHDTSRYDYLISNFGNCVDTFSLKLALEPRKRHGHVHCTLLSLMESCTGHESRENHRREARRQSSSPGGGEGGLGSRKPSALGTEMRGEGPRSSITMRSRTKPRSHSSASKIFFLLVFFHVIGRAKKILLLMGLSLARWAVLG